MRVPARATAVGIAKAEAERSRSRHRHRVDVVPGSPLRGFEVGAVAGVALPDLPAGDRATVHRVP